jgi:purine-nucleoside phosphorylase
MAIIQTNQQLANQQLANQQLANQQPANQQQAVDVGVQYVRSRWAKTPRLGLILGTGLHQLVDGVTVEEAIDYGEIPQFPRSTALSHRGRYLCGSLDGTPVMVMDGRCHFYEGYSAPTLMLPVQAMAAMGIETLVVSNAAGGVNPQFSIGDVMVLSSHINLMWQIHGTADDCGIGRSFSTTSDLYCSKIRNRALAVARQHNFVAHQGVYVGVTGPNYETRAEYRMFRQMGGDAVGMSTVPEALAASQYEIPVLGLSMITNVAKPDAPEIVDAEEVIQAARLCAPNMSRIVLDLAQNG